MSGKTYLRNQKFFQRNYSEAIKFILPEYLYDDDVSGTPKSDDLVDTIINSHIDIADNFSSVLNVSAVENSVFSGINTLNGIAPYFVKQNNLTNITTQNFEDNVLSFFNTKLKDFKTQGDFSSYVESTLLPAINLNKPDESIFSTIGDSSSIHNYLISNLSWMYFLNTSGPSFDPSSYVKDLLVSGIYEGKPFRTKDGINGLSEYVWRNASSAYYPSEIFDAGFRSDLSGTQQLDKLKTWNDVIYSELFSDSSDFRVRDKFETYIENTLKSAIKIEDGPFARLIRALSFFAFDINNDTEQISTLYDIDDCPDEYLPLVSQLIGWDLFGNNPERWRLQLRNAVSIYKAVGTKKAIQSTVNTIFPKNSFPIEGRISELWESYVPFLIYYSLATESNFYKDFSTWTPDLAANMNVEKYSSSSMDDNIRLSVDRILLEVIRQFPDNFPINSWLTEFDGTFKYRGRDYSIPPFEEYPYYVNTELDAAMVGFIAERLVAFGVRPEFALDVSSYITTNALDVVIDVLEESQPKTGTWLIFTSGYNAPPNLDNLIRNISSKNFDYASLWSGKSSHFKLVLDSSEFDFNKKNVDTADSGDALQFVADVVNKFAPAHAIPLISLEISAAPDVLGFEASCLPHIYLDSEEIDVGAGSNRFASGIFLNTYKRGINTNGAAIGKAATQTLVSPELINVPSIGGVPRKSSRRRSYEKIMPFNGYSDRTGFNMPVSFDMSSDLSGVPLGLIPSSLTYNPVSSFINLPPIWAQCENLNSANTYFEYDVSNTQNIRGKAGSMQQNKDRTTDRGQLPAIYAVMHRIGEGKKTFKALQDIEASASALNSYLDDLLLALSLVATQFERNALINEIERVRALLNGDTRSLVTSGTNANADGYTFPASVSDYYNFEFGRDLHRLYKSYQENFKWHRLSPDIQNKDGANIFSHTFGPLLYNHDFENLGTVKTPISTSLSATQQINVLNDAFTGTGSFAATGDSDMYLGTFERVSSGVLDAVEMVLTSGIEDGASFSVIRVPGSQRISYEDPFLFDNTFITMRAGDRASTRLRFDISKYSAGSDYPVANNFLSPDHDFKLNLNSLISTDSGTTFGGRGIGVWIHTKPEDGKMWSFSPNGDWVQHNQLISRSDMFKVYAHTKNVPLRSNDPSSFTTTSISNFASLSQVSSVRTSPIFGISPTDFEDLEITFNTRNRDIRLPNEYRKEYGQLHRLNQNYVIEVFIIPGGQPDQFMLVDSLKVQDLTLDKLSQVFAGGTLSNTLCKLKELNKECLEYRLALSKQDLFDIFKHFNNITGKNAATAYASRDKSKTAAIMESEGGSKIDYRLPNELITVLNPAGVINTTVTIPI